MCQLRLSRVLLLPLPMMPPSPKQPRPGHQPPQQRLAGAPGSADAHPAGAPARLQALHAPLPADTVPWEGRGPGTHALAASCCCRCRRPCCCFPATFCISVARNSPARQPFAAGAQPERELSALLSQSGRLAAVVAVGWRRSATRMRSSSSAADMVEQGSWGALPRVPRRLPAASQPSCPALYHCTALPCAALSCSCRRSQGCACCTSTTASTAPPLLRRATGGRSSRCAASPSSPSLGCRWLRCRRLSWA